MRQSAGKCRPSMITAIVLAAGASTRMGVPKLLLPLKGKSILRHVTETALTSTCDAVVVVLGAHAEQLRGEVEGTGASIVINPDWQEGLSTSIRAGVEAASSLSEDLEAVLLLLADQPLVSVETIDRLIQTFRATGKAMIASAYSGTMGPPILFARPLFIELLTLEGDKGAKDVLARYPEQVVTVPAPEAAVDIDTIEDYRRAIDSGEIR